MISLIIGFFKRAQGGALAEIFKNGSLSETKMPYDTKLSTEKITPKLVDYIVRKIVAGIQPEKIIIFGSYATGVFTEESDLDLLIIKDGLESSRAIRRKVDALLRGRRFPVDLFIRKTEEVEWNRRAENPFYLNHIFKDGKVVYEKSRTV